MPTAKKLTLFNKLPAELQFQIWEDSLSAMRLGHVSARQA